MSDEGVRSFVNAAYAGAEGPVVSVLTPFLRDDPCALVRALKADAEGLDLRVEILLLDDGTGDAALEAAARETLTAIDLPGRLISLARNEGRAKGRNRLARAARGCFLLFLDADMRPADPGFLKAWVDLAERAGPVLAFGGLKDPGHRVAPAYRVHQALSSHSECAPPEKRSLTPEKFVFSSNLLVRKDAFLEEPFDGEFLGWGWEDVEWGMRMARRHPILHPDIPAIHLGLDCVEALARKYEQSVGNFARTLNRHPRVMQAYPVYRVARALRRVPGLPRLRDLLKRLALTARAPVRLRAFALRLYRAALYAEVVA